MQYDLGNIKNTLEDCTHIALEYIRYEFISLHFPIYT